MALGSGYALCPIAHQKQFPGTRNCAPKLSLLEVSVAVRAPARIADALSVEGGGGGIAHERPDA